MKGTAEQLQYIMRDEVLHASFGMRVAKQIIFEEKIQPDPKALREMWDEAEAAETGYANYLLADPILGYSKEDHLDQFRFIANRRARYLDLDGSFDLAWDPASGGFVVEDGCLRLLDKPGLGVELRV